MEALRPLTKQGALNTGSVLLVGAEYLPLDELAAAILKENKSFEVNVVEVVRSSLAYVDVNFFLGKVCFLAVGDKSVKHQVVEMYTLKQLADSYLSPLIPAELESTERRAAIAKRLLQMLKVAAGLVPGVSALALSSLIRPSFKTEAVES
ncbi:centromere protein M isoform X2 [Leucoraja erinacea]|uniref:centromere protein M isoform X2 n=1 Tax=Leucoraja erinaceus TaxID=7782 RepID=UPI002458A3E7|nr:centromere protein M isoform X2 [Leucoraja erinacea]